MILILTFVKNSSRDPYILNTVYMTFREALYGVALSLEFIFGWHIKFIDPKI